MGVKVHSYGDMARDLQDMAKVAEKAPMFQQPKMAFEIVTRTLKLMEIMADRIDDMCAEQVDQSAALVSILHGQDAAAAVEAPANDNTAPSTGAGEGASA